MHKSVLPKEVIEYLKPKPGENFIDCTLGQGGHAFSILDLTGPSGQVLGIDWDKESLNRFCAQHPDLKPQRLIVANGNYSRIREIAEKLDFKPVNGVLLDIGLSSWHFEESGRGFGFSKDEYLDMRYDTGVPESASGLVNRLPQKDLERILREWGEEKFARSISRKIVVDRARKPITTTLELVEAVKKGVPTRYHDRRPHFATRTFQALRIAVNHELENLETALPSAYGILSPGGRLVVISFHSLEDRIVKNRFRELKASEGAIILTKKPISPQQEEINSNPRSRSAKLRAIMKPEA
ncbi:MAG TPA: 16S rRNA (cytosine(1402)-N(4))-methyltransferase RsmH [Candidatus Paceibacterota bacterium]|nr:16S rRNA (cytosine(1402)-N(4))-methyltransferase RsmH [Candidatus Pacearchaeota archaeon]HRZ51113.1 16S rRNA (cytosine(1402)-N(4))-methyltransferase RsmH [Candidatus Paceibacterota bacterium]HSA36880.1 16S rRNA (cytosine(1402)-N(4))-methyltransferase RsmH [Candidatus Paceibacterota bacterium]